MRLICLLLTVWISTLALAQTEQLGADRFAKVTGNLEFEYIGYRPTRYDTDLITEIENERPNLGGFVSVYWRNVSDSPMDLRFFRLNDKDESHWRLGDFLAFDRLYDPHLDPGQIGVLELSGVTADFGPDQRFDIAYIDSSWAPQGGVLSTLWEDPVKVSYIRFLPGFNQIEVHLRNDGEHRVPIKSITVEGHAANNVEWTTPTLDPGKTAIARVTLESPLRSSELTVVRIELAAAGATTRAIYSHRRAFEDWYPIGTWGIDPPEKYHIYRSHHIDMGVKDGPAGDPFWETEAARFGFKTMTPARHHNIDSFRSLIGNPSVGCWMLSDEPDWNTRPSDMAYLDKLVRHYDTSIPTFITLCRNVKFFDYARIPDIICHDHYCVGAPSSSKWPTRYGTYLEETGVYTRDLKYAAEPNPVWVWSQGVHDWSRRPKRILPTPEELAVQVLQNIGYGSKGIIWFTFKLEVGEQYPDAREEIRRWGRVMRMAREELIAAEPYAANIESSTKLDVMPLAAWDRVLVAVTNKDYDLNEEAYVFRTVEDATLALELPSWINTAEVLDLSPDGPTPLEHRIRDGKVVVEVGDLRVGRLLAICGQPSAEQYRERYNQIIANEKSYTAMQ